MQGKLQCAQVLQGKGRIVKYIFVLLATVLLVSCGGQQTEQPGEAGEEPQSDAPDYEVVSEQETQQGDVNAAVYNVETEAATAEDLRLITEDLYSQNPNLNTVSIGAYDPQGEMTGAAQYFDSKDTARVMLPNYSEGELDNVMEMDGYTILSMSDLEEEMETLEETTAAPPAMPSIAVGEALEGAGFELRVLDYFVTDSYLYADYVYSDGTFDQQEVLPGAGQFLIINYSVRNAGQSPLQIGFEGTLGTEAGEFYEESGDAFHPNALLDGVSGGFELAPRQLELGQLVFDVPQDIEPASASVSFADLSETSEGYPSEAMQIDLTERESPGGMPDEVLALQYEYANMFAFEQAYELFAAESKDVVSSEDYVGFYESGEPTVVSEYSFPSVETQDDQATIDRIITVSDRAGDEQLQAIQEAVREDDGWRIVMRDEQIELFTGGGSTMIEETTG